MRWVPHRRIVNARSVGEPRHGTKATCVIYNEETELVTVREVGYDVQKTCKAINDVGLLGICMAIEPWL